MEDRETARIRKFGESKTTRIMTATVPHVISGLGLRKFQTDGFLLTRLYITVYYSHVHTDYVHLTLICMHFNYFSYLHLFHGAELY